jgi:hypothetical protein
MMNTQGGYRSPLAGGFTLPTTQPQYVYGQQMKGPGMEKYMGAFAPGTPNYLLMQNNPMAPMANAAYGAWQQGQQQMAGINPWAGGGGGYFGGPGAVFNPQDPAMMKQLNSWMGMQANPYGGGPGGTYFGNAARDIANLPASRYGVRGGPSAQNQALEAYLGNLASQGQDNLRYGIDQMTQGYQRAWDNWFNQQQIELAKQRMAQAAAQAAAEGDYRMAELLTNLHGQDVSQVNLNLGKGDPRQARIDRDLAEKRWREEESRRRLIEARSTASYPTTPTTASQGRDYIAHLRNVAGLA